MKSKALHVVEYSIKLAHSGRFLGYEYNSCGTQSYTETINSGLLGKNILEE